MPRLLRRQSGNSGQGIVEFALIAPVFFLLVFGTIELSWMLFNNHSLASATREGARYAMVNGEQSGDIATEESVRTVVEERATMLSGPIQTEVIFSPDAAPGSQVTVRTAYDYQPLAASIAGIDSIRLTSSSTVIVQF